MVKEVRSPDALDFERKMRDSIVESAEALNNSGADFATFDESRCNPQFWTRTDIGGLQLNAGVAPSVGIKDIFQNGHLYAFECATAMVIVMYRATIEAIGEEAFNRYFKDLFLWDWNYDENLRLVTNYNKDQMLREILCISGIQIMRLASQSGRVRMLLSLKKTCIMATALG